MICLCKEFSIEFEINPLFLVRNLVFFQYPFIKKALKATFLTLEENE